MNYRERIWAGLRGEPVDYVPFAPRWDLWFNAAKLDGRLPAKYQGWDMFDMAKDLGFGVFDFYAPLFRTELHGVTVTETRKGSDTLIVYETPVGTVSEVHGSTPDLESGGVRGQTTQHLIQSIEDYGPVMYNVEHTEVIPAYEEFLARDRRIGEAGLALGLGFECPAHHIMREFTGYQGFYYALYDHPNEVDRLIDAVSALYAKMEAVVLDSPADIIRVGSNFDTQLTSPPIFRRYFAPYFREFSARAHQRGKWVCAHTDSRMDGLMELILDSGFDVAEAFTPPPMTNIDIADARRVWGNRVAIWGGLASILFSLSIPDEVLEAHIRAQLAQMHPGDRFVLGMGDNVPTDSSLDRILRVQEIVEEQGELTQFEI
ncbi:MAG: hypothetical protein M5R36_10100 [Deltaproteobacteria bacterium]|nr:hypothetical protein [Deltaproteobacteria bacterium]